MPTETVKHMLDAAESAVHHAQSTRAYHRKRSNTGSRQRRTDVQVALKRIQQAMRPIRTYIGYMPYRPARDGDDAIRDASRALQRERRKLWKLLNPTKRRPKARTPA